MLDHKRVWIKIATGLIGPGLAACLRWSAVNGSKSDAGSCWHRSLAAPLGRAPKKPAFLHCTAR